MDLEQLILMALMWQHAGDEGGGGGGDEGGGDDGGDAGDRRPPPIHVPSRRPTLPGDELEDDGDDGDEGGKGGDDRLQSDLQRRDAELVELKRQLQQERQSLAPLMQAQQLLGQGKRSEALQVMGLDRRDLVADEWGDALLPEREPPKPEEQIEQLRSGQETQAQKIERLERDLAYSELSRDLRDELDTSQDPEEFAIARHMASKGRGVYYRGMVDQMLQDGVGNDRQAQREWLVQKEKDVLDKLAPDLSDLLKIEKIRKKVGVEFVPQKGGKKKRSEQPPARRPARDEPDLAASLTNDLSEDPPVTQKPRGKLSREERKARAIEILRRAREKAEQEEQQDR